MVFDGDAFGAQMVEIVRGYVAAELEPLLAANKALEAGNIALAERIAVLEARELVLPEKGEPGLDGKDADMQALEALIDAKVAALPVARDGRDGRDVEDITVTQDGAVVEFAFTVGDIRSIFEIELPQGEPGKDGEKGDPGPVGSLPPVKAWEDGVHYAGIVRSFAGGTWQAIKDTAKEPPHEDWICIAAPGANGQDGKSLNPRRLWVAEEEYSRLDVVALNGGSFVALKDNPGPCPGEGWMLMTSPGKRGERGERGEKGERGLAGVLVAATIDDDGLQTLVNGDGTTVQCDLYPLLSQIGR